MSCEDVECTLCGARGEEEGEGEKVKVRKPSEPPKL